MNKVSEIDSAKSTSAQVKVSFPLENTDRPSVVIAMETNDNSAFDKVNELRLQNPKMFQMVI